MFITNKKALIERSGLFHARHPRRLQAVGSLELATTTVQNRLGVTVRLFGALDHQFDCRLEGDVAVEVRG